LTIKECLQSIIEIGVERKKAEEALKASEERYAYALSGANDGIWDWDLESDQIYFSDRWKKIAGLELSHLMENRSNWIEIIHEKDKTKFQEDLEKHLNGQTPFFINEHRISYTETDFRWVLVRGLAFRNHDDKPIRIAGSFDDIVDH